MSVLERRRPSPLNLTSKLNTRVSLPRTSAALSSSHRSLTVGGYSSGVGRLVELQVSGEDLALRLALRSVDAGRGSGRG
jgi:hypothetical protein